jgi:flagellar hook-associated protein 2
VPTTTLAKLALGQIKGASDAGFTSGTLTINGVQVGATFDGTTSTLGSVISAINSSSGTGVTASVNAVDGSLVLTSNTIGSNAISISATGGLDAALGLDSTAASVSDRPTLTTGSGVIFNLKVNGAPVGSLLSSDSTTIDTSKYGFGSVQFTPGSTGKFNVKVSGSGSAYKTKINTFISAYNTLRQTLEDATKITVNADGSVSTSLFSTRTDINTLTSSIRSKMYASVTDSSINSSYNNISKIGLGFDSSGVLSITDSDKLDLALANNPSSVDALLNANKSITASTAAAADQGVATRIYSLMYALTDTTGLIKTSTTSLTAQSKRLQTQIDNMTRSLAQTRSTLEASFIAMERAQSKYQSMTQQITSAFK